MTLRNANEKSPPKKVVLKSLVPRIATLKNVARKRRRRIKRRKNPRSPKNRKSPRSIGDDFFEDVIILKEFRIEFQMMLFLE